MTISSFHVPLDWNNVVLSIETGQVYEYPGKFTAYMRERYSRPAVYRWSVHPFEPGKPQPVYIGEADSLTVRIQRVLTPAKTTKSGDTNGRLKRMFDEYVASGRRVSLAILDFGPFEFDGALFAADRLDHQYVRRTLENIALCIAEREGKELLNRKLEPLKRKIQELFKLRSDQASELMRHVKRLREKDDCGEPSS